MKLCILFFAILGVATATALPDADVDSRMTRGLEDDLNDFLALVPTDQVLELAIVYLAEDEQVQAVVEYILSEDFVNLVSDVQQIPEYIAFLNYLQDSGLDVYKWVNLLNELLGLPELSYSISTRSIGEGRITGGVEGLITDILAIIDVDAVRALYWEKLETSPAFAGLVQTLGSPEAQNAYAALKANPEYQAIRTKVEDLGIDVDRVLNKLRELIGLSGYSVSRSSSKSLSDDLEDFLALIDADLVIEVLIVYLAEDAEVQAALEYLMSEEFANLILAVEAIPEYIAFLDYLQAGGLEVYYWVNRLHELLGLDPLDSRSLNVNRPEASRITGGVAGLVADLLAVLPLEDLRALFNEKLETSADFAALVSLFTSDEAKVIYENLKANPEYQNIRATLVGVGLDVDAIFAVLKGLIGWGY